PFLFSIFFFSLSSFSPPAPSPVPTQIFPPPLPPRRHVSVLQPPAAAAPPALQPPAAAAPPVPKQPVVRRLGRAPCAAGVAATERRRWPRRPVCCPPVPFHHTGRLGSASTAGISQMDNLLMRLMEDDSSSDDDFDVATILLADLAENEPPKWGGSVPGHEVVRRNKQQANEKLFDDYFAEDPVYGPDTFRRRFRMSKRLFLRIANAVEAHCPYFQQRRNAAGDLGHSALKKITVALRMLAYGCPADALDETFYIAESTIIKSLREFVKAVIEIFGEQYLRAPNEDDTTRLMQMGAAKGFPGMLGCIDCMHWEWKCKCIDTMGYYLADGIYPSWSTFVKTIRNANSNKTRHFAKAQEAARKDVERAFGVLQSRFAIVRGPVRFWDQETLWRIMTACVIMHNMIIEDERGQPEDFEYEDMGDRVEPEHNEDRIKTFLEMHRKIEDREAHDQLRDDLIEHLWQILGQ
ncbi:unnamed protein product, partial [Urochloa humidicola]